MIFSLAMLHTSLLFLCFYWVTFKDAEAKEGFQFILISIIPGIPEHVLCQIYLSRNLY
ncbi:hypothetical protein MANES_08G051501v8 [Manihot esculenta]|uniref:Uncharacterized protein n=1 Tax=Manihot esculenta TaxID=3983 RepID=A0A2C9VDK0_MANES|nr:hypothetical protein MANES_08G051501v8 [Manihot esculenta]